MNGKIAKKCRLAAKQVYANVVIPKLVEAKKNGTYATAMQELPTPADLYKQIKRAYRRENKG